MAETIERLRVYKLARRLEDEIYEFVKQLPQKHYYGLDNDLRRSSAAVSHHIMQAHRLYSYDSKLDELVLARQEAALVQIHLESARFFGIDQYFADEYTIMIKQTWGLTRWLLRRIDERQEQFEIHAKDEHATLQTPAHADNKLRLAERAVYYQSVVRPQN
jgi:four helix bundle protein